ncbi:MAG TPA: hypothetical protein VF498_11880, partial [Anaerolineales bacterium]
REALSRALAVAEERMRSLHIQHQEAHAELAGLQEELGLHQERLSAADQEVERLEAELVEARSQVEAARQALAERQAERARSERELQAERQGLSALNARQGQLQARLSERKAQAERSQKTLDGAAQAVEAAEQELKRAEAGLQASRQAQQQAEAARQSAEQALQAHRPRLSQLEAARKKALDQRSAASADLARLKAQWEVLEQAENSLTGYAGGTRLLLQAERQARLSGTRGALSSQLEVPAELETAIAAALGEYLDSVLLDSDVGPALDLLLKESSRGVLLPLRSLKPAPVLTLDGDHDGILGIAADLVSAPPELRPALDLLLGQVLVARDRQAAQHLLSRYSRQAASELPGAVLRVVTLRGEVFLSNGPVLTGGAGAGGPTILSRQRQRGELTRNIAGAEGQVEEAGQRLRQLDEELKALQAEGERLGQAQRSARQTEEKTTLAAKQAALGFEQAGRQVRWQQEQRDRQQSELARAESEAAGMSADLAQLETSISQARERVRECSQVLAALSLDDFQSQAGHWNTQAAVAERALADGKDRQRERQTALDRAAKSQAALQARQAEIEAALQGLEIERAAQRQSEGEVGAEIEALRALIDPAEAELDGLEQQQKALQTAEAAARQALSLAEHHHAQARIALARCQEALESLRRRVEDDFGLVAFDYEADVSGPTPLPLQGMVEQLPRVDYLSPEAEETMKRQRAQLKRMGAINPEAQAEYQEVKERFKFMKEQVADLEKAEIDVRQVIAELDGLMEREFRKTFEAVAVEFKDIFTRLFGGGTAHLVLTNPDDLTDTGIDIEARLPGRRIQGLSLLSGGERSLTATALVFALLKVSPTPFCVLDEVDAMLDEANVGRLRDLLGELSRNTQFVVVTHNRNTVQVADVIYGVTMGHDSASQVLSLKLDEVSRVVE